MRQKVERRRLKEANIWNKQREDMKLNALMREMEYKRTIKKAKIYAKQESVMRQAKGYQTSQVGKYMKQASDTRA